MVPGRIDVTSPQARPVNNRSPAGHHDADPQDIGDTRPVTPGDTAQRWLDIDVYDAPPLPAALEPVPMEWRVITLYARDAGRLSAQLFVDIGPMTGDIGDRGFATVSFEAIPARTVTLAVSDVDGGPVTCSLLIRDAQGRIVPAQTKRALPDLYFQQTGVSRRRADADAAAG